MAVSKKRAPSGAQEFRVPFAGAVPGAPLRAGGSLVLRTEGDDARPVSLQIKLRPLPVAFMAKLPALVRGTPYEADLYALGTAARSARPVLIYEARPAVRAQVPPGLTSLAQLEAYLASEPPLYDFSAYDLAAIAFEQEA